MNTGSSNFLHRLLDTPAPSGFETPAARIWRREAEGLTAHVSVDVSGNSMAGLNPGSAPHLMLAGHIDEIGLMIIHVDEQGFLYFKTIGGWDVQVLVGQRVVIASRRGPVPGVIGKKAIHLIKTEDREKVSKCSDLWIDIGASTREEALERIRIGDPAVLEGATRTLPGNRLVSRSIDNRIGAYIVLETIRRLHADPPTAAVTAVATVQEEIGWMGGGALPSASALHPSVALVVDVTHATDHPGVEEKETGQCRLGAGAVITRGSAVNPEVFEFLVETAESEKIAFTVAAAPRDTGTDADPIHLAHHGIATGLVSVPNRYMHSPNEMVSLDDVEAVIRLLAAFAHRLDGSPDFIPR